MNKRERIRLLIGCIVMAVLFGAVASIGWTKDEFLVTYHYGFDDRYEIHTVKKGYVKEPPSTGRYGYVFDGWYYTDRFGNEHYFDFETEKITTDIELTAHWKPFETEIRLILPSGLGECEHESITVPYGSAYTLPEATREGYYFVGWESPAKQIMNSGVWTLPVEVYKVKAQWSKFPPGKTYFLGEYEQDIDLDGKKEPIEWIPIEKKDGKYLLVSKYILDVGCLGRKDGRGGYVSWADCTLREWLNGKFYDEAFSEAEKNMICDFYDEDLGTTDIVFLPSLEEAKLLVGVDGLGVGTVYVNQAGLHRVTVWAESKVDGKTVKYPYWLTRSNKNNKNWSFSGGGIGGASAKQYFGLRPAIWVDASKLAGS